MTIPLQLLWLASWILAGGSVAGMGLLLGARLWRERAEARRRVTRAVIIQAYLGAMAGAPDAVARLDGHADVSILAEALLELLGMIRGGDRDRLVAALCAFGLDRRLRLRLDRGRPSERMAAAEALSVFPGPENEAALRPLLEAGGPELRLAAAKSLLLMGARIDGEAFVRIVEARRDPRAASMADIFRLLAERQPADCAALLARVEIAQPLRVMLADALGGSSDYGVMPLLQARALDDAPAVRAACLRALGRLMHPAAKAVVASAIADTDSEVRAAAAAAAGAAGYGDLTPELVESLHDPVWTVRFQAAEALASLGARGLAALREAARTGSGEAARTASLALGERGL